MFGRGGTAGTVYWTKFSRLGSSGLHEKHPGGTPPTLTDETIFYQFFLQKTVIFRKLSRIELRQDLKIYNIFESVVLGL